MYHTQPNFKLARLLNKMLIKKEEKLEFKLKKTLYNCLMNVINQ